MSATHALAPASAAMVSTATIVTTTASETSSDEEEVVTILQVLRARKEIPRIKMASGKRKQSAPQQLGRSKNLQSTAKPKSIVINVSDESAVASAGAQQGSNAAGSAEDSSLVAGLKRQATWFCSLPQLKLHPENLLSRKTSFRTN